MVCTKKGSQIPIGLSRHSIVFTFLPHGLVRVATGRVLPLRQKLTRQCTGFCRMDAGGMTQGGKPPHQFEVLRTDLAYSGWRKIVKKTVRIEEEKEYVFDVVHQASNCTASFIMRRRLMKAWLR